MKMTSEHTIHVGLIILMLTMLLVIIIYMIGAEVDMVEKCREFVSSSTKLNMNAERFGIVFTLIIMAILVSIISISQTNIITN